MLMRGGENDCNACQDQPTASWFAKGSWSREEQLWKNCQRDNDYHIFHVWLKTADRRNSLGPFSGTSYRAMHNACHACIWLIDTLKRTKLQYISAFLPRIAHLIRFSCSHFELKQLWTEPVLMWFTFTLCIQCLHVSSEFFRMSGKDLVCLNTCVTNAVC